MLRHESGLASGIFRGHGRPISEDVEFDCDMAARGFSDPGARLHGNGKRSSRKSGLPKRAC